MTDWNRVFGGGGGGGGGSTDWGSVFGGGAGTAAPHPSPSSGGGGFLSHLGGFGDVLGNLISDAEQTARGFPQGIMLAGGALKYDIMHPLAGSRFSSERSHVGRDVLTPIEQSYQQTYSPLLHGRFREFGNIVEQHPLGPILDVATVFSGGAAGLGKVGQVTRSLGSTGRLARYADYLESPRVVQVRIGGREGVPVPLELRRAKTPYGRALNRLTDFLGTRYQEAPIVGNIRRDVRQMGRKVQQQRSQHIALIRPFERSLKPLDNDERFAYHLAFEGRSPRAAFQSAFDLNAMEPSVQLRRYMERLATKRWSQIERDMAEGIDPMADSRVAAAVREPREEFVAAVRAGKELEAAGADPLLRTGVLAPEYREARKWLGRRLERGARFEERSGPTPHQRGAAKQVDQLERQHEKILTQIAKKTDKAEQTLQRLEDERLRLAMKGNLTRDERSRLTRITNRVNRMQAFEANRLTQDPLAARAQRIGSALSVARDRLQQAGGLPEDRPAGFVNDIPLDVLRAEREAEIASRVPTEVSGEFGTPARFPHEATETRENILTHIEGQRAATKMPGAPKSTKRNRGVRLLTARLITRPEMLSRDYLRSMNFHLITDSWDEMKERAIPLDPAKAGTPDDRHVYFRMGDVGPSRAVREADPIMRDRYLADIERGGRAMTEQQLERIPRDIVWDRESQLPGDIERGTVERLTEQGVWQIHERYAKQFLRETHQSNAFMRRFFDKPLDVWRAIVLNYRPAWLVNNIVGQHLLYFLNHAGPRGIKAYLMALQRERGDSALNPLRRWTRNPKYGVLLDEVRPGSSFGGFFRSQNFGEGGMYLGEGRLGQAAERARERGRLNPGRVAVGTATGAGRAVRSFGDAMTWLNVHVADDLVRRAAFLREAERSPAIRRIRGQTRMFKRANKTLSEALREADPATLEHLIDEVNRALGNFAQLGPWERQYIRRAVPFYSWFKTIAMVTGGLALDHPGRILMLQLMADVGEGNKPGGPMPSYLEGAIPLSPAQGGEQTLLSTMAVNPFETPIALGEAAASAIPYMRRDESGNPDVNQRGTASIFGLLNPIVGAGAAAMGRDIFYGSDYRGPGAGRGPIAQGVGYFAGLPQFRLAEQLGLYGDYQSKLYNPNYRLGGIPPALWAYLGLPVRRVKLGEAASRAKAGQ